MYCPECGAEYRPIATVCSDCQVALVPNPPDPAEKDSASQEDYIVLLWSGSNPAERAVVQEALERENIPVRALRREDTILPLGHAPIEVYVPSSFAEKATEILNQLNPGEPADGDDASNEIPAEDDLPETEDQYRDLRHWNREDATVELWAGRDTDLANMVKACLRENQIPCRSSADEAEDESESGNAAASPERLYVLPEDEARAKEILREIVDAVPPQ
jgi:hypothetical protein